MYFVPDFDKTDGYYQAAPGWFSYWDGVVDGLFSWEAAWPSFGGYGGNYPGDISPDQTVINGAAANQKGYMIALSTLQYKDAYDTNLYRPGGINLPVRMSNILSMSPQPDFVEVITWNDGGESHYIANLFPEENSNPATALYTTNFDHSAWQPLVTSFIAAFKAGLPSSAMSPPTNALAVGAMWYKTILQNQTCSGPQPQAFSNGSDTLNWAVVLAPGGSGLVRGTSNGVVLQTVSVGAGLSWGAFGGVQYGSQVLELLDLDGNLVMATGQGGCVEADCPNEIYNMNYQVVGLVQENGGTLGCFSI